MYGAWWGAAYEGLHDARDARVAPARQLHLIANFRPDCALVFLLRLDPRTGIQSHRPPNLTIGIRVNDHSDRAPALPTRAVDEEGVVPERVVDLEAVRHLVQVAGVEVVGAERAGFEGRGLGGACRGGRL